MKEEERLAKFSIIMICGIVLVFMIIVLLSHAPAFSMPDSSSTVGKAAELMQGGPSGKNTCADSDGGKNFLAFGTVKGINNNLYYSKSDACMGPNVLREYHCEQKGSESFVKSVFVNCPAMFKGKLCKTGACA